MYSQLAKKLKTKGYKVFTPDLPGFGKERPLKRPFSLNDYADFVKNYISKNKLKKIILIGHSFGGRAAIKFCENNPKTVEKLILTGVPAFPVNSIKRLIFLAAAKAGKLILALPLFEKMQTLGRKIIYRLAGSFDYPKTQGVMRKTFVKIVRADLLPSMRKIKIPTYIIWGEKDIITPLWIARKMNKIIPNSHLIIVSGKNHNVVYKHPDLFLAKLAIL